MADIQVPANQWVSAHARAGLPAGVGLLLQNKNPFPVTVQESLTQPPSTSRDGFLLGYMMAVEVDPDSPGVWLFSHTAPAILFVQGD